MVNVDPLLTILLLIGIPCLIYAFFCVLPPCPPLFWTRPRGCHQSSAAAAEDNNIMSSKAETVMSTIKYIKKEDDDYRNDECPVCLSVFVEEEEIKQLNSCKHTFHGACIDRWFSSDHSSCPICRNPIPLAGKRPKPRPAVDDGDDFRQGLPDASSLV